MICVPYHCPPASPITTSHVYGRVSELGRHRPAWCEPIIHPQRDQGAVLYFPTQGKQCPTEEKLLDDSWQVFSDGWSEAQGRRPSSPQVRASSELHLSCPLGGKVSLLGWAGQDTSGCNSTLQGYSEAPFQMHQRGGNQIVWAPIQPGQRQTPRDDIAWAGPQAHLPLATPPREGGTLLEEARCCLASSTAVNGWFIIPLSWRLFRHRTWVVSWLLTALLRRNPPLAGSCQHWLPNGDTEGTKGSETFWRNWQIWMERCELRGQDVGPNNKGWGWC